MSELIAEIVRTISRSYKPLTIVKNHDGFLARPEVRPHLAKALDCEVVVGSQIELRVHYELHLRRHPERKAYYILASDAEMLPDIAVNATTLNFKITNLFPNFEDKETISRLSYNTLSALFEKRIQGRVSADRLGQLVEQIEGSKAAEGVTDYGEAVIALNAIDNPDWSDVKTIKRISELLIRAVEAGRYAEVSDKIADLNFDFQHYLQETYSASINANPFIRPKCVNGIVPHIASKYGATDKVALVVVDGMAFWQYEVLRQVLEENGVTPKNENWLYSWIPSITSLSRQAIFRGEIPKMDYNQSPGSERTLWAKHWNEASQAPRYFTGDDALMIPYACRRLALVTVALDEKMHSSTSYADLLALTKIWAKDFARTIKTIKEEGFTILLTTDHGNVLATGWRRISQAETAHLYGKMSRGHRHAIFMNDRASQDFESALGYAVSTMHRDRWFAISDNSSFTTPGKTEITHGGSHLFEVMIPFIEF